VSETPDWQPGGYESDNVENNQYSAEQLAAEQFDADLYAANQLPPDADEGFEVFYAPQVASSSVPPVVEAVEQVAYPPVAEYPLPVESINPVEAQTVVATAAPVEYVDFASRAKQPVKLDKRGWISNLVSFLVLTALVFITMTVANLINRDFGHVNITQLEITSPEIPGTLAATLYRPINATANNPAPGVLLLHGYQNDKGAVGSLATELARRGYVVMALDQYGHGDTTVGMAERGYVNQRLADIFGIGQPNDQQVIGGPVRYRVMLNFSNLDFFNPEFSSDAAGNSLQDTSMGGVLAYAALSEMDFVDASRLAVGGHSMGTWSSWSVAAYYSNIVNNDGVALAPRAIVLQAGELFTDDVYDSQNIHFNNVLLFTARYDEFANFRDYQNVVSNELIQTPLRAGFLGLGSQPENARWNTTFGNFNDGTARRNELVETNHRLVAVHHQTIAVAIDWLDAATGHYSGWSPYNQLFQISMALVFAAMLLAVFSMVPLLELLLNIPFFASAAGPIYTRPERVKSIWKWWRGAIITCLIAFVSYPFLVQLGHGLTPLPESVFRMTIGNGFLTWYVFLIIVMLLTTIIPWRRAANRGKRVVVETVNAQGKKVRVRQTQAPQPMQWGDLGVANTWDGSHFGWATLFRSLVLAFLMTGYVYFLVTLFDKWFGLDFRIIWPFLRPFNNHLRVGQFLLYLPIFVLFFIMNNMKIFGQMGSVAAARPGWRGFMSCWWRGAVCMAGGIFLICLLMYVPFFMGLGPGVDLLVGSTFGGPFMSLLLLFFPQVIVLSLLCTAIYRKTGQVFLSGTVAGILSCWIIAGGSPFI